MTQLLKPSHVSNSNHAAFSSLSAVSYIRVSTLRQAERGSERDGFSIPAQREANLRQAHGLGSLIAAKFVDRGRSGRSCDRPALKRMLSYLREHSIDYVIVHKLDRLARSRADDIAITESIRDTGARLVSSTEGIDASPNGTLLHGIMASIAEFYSRNLAQEVMKGMRQKVVQGGTPSRAPIGYLNVRRQADDGREIRTVVVDPERASHVAWAFEAYATGEWSVAQLVAVLEKRGLRTRPTPARPAAAPTVPSFHRVLINPYYRGVVTMNGAQHAGLHDPLVSAATWDTVQRLLKARRSGERSRIHTHYLKSTIYCFSCHRRLIVHKARSQSGRIYDYFVCSGRQSGTPRCTQSALPIASVERRVEGAYSTIEIDDRRRRQIEQAHQRRIAGDAVTREQRRVELDEQSRLLASRQEKLLDLYYSDGIARETLVKEQKELSQGLTRINEELSLFREDTDSAVRRVSEVLDLLGGAHARYIAATPDVRKQMNNSLFNRVLIGPGDEDLLVELRDEITEILTG
ncbi:recombinase family protein [Leucobacter allii]|uniref:recombinase family protein n=1 Tax=Leucobacter allii TaxID=2932247 RepID=UPI001FD1AF60|nr:recombinase family protein [Leucobacter allii]UOR02475.1 recombinase family protein [Leucobacter allii]